MFDNEVLLVCSYVFVARLLLSSHAEIPMRSVMAHAIVANLPVCVLISDEKITSSQALRY